MKMFRNIVDQWFIFRRVLAWHPLKAHVERCHFLLFSQSLSTAGGGSSFSCQVSMTAPASFCHQAHVSSSCHGHLGTSTWLLPSPQGRWMPAIVWSAKYDPQRFSSLEPVTVLPYRAKETFHRCDLVKILRWGGDTGVSSGLDVTTRILMKGRQRVRVMLPRDKECEQPPGARKARNGFSPSLQKEHSPVGTWILAQCKWFWTSELCKCQVINLCCRTSLGP